jgi:hypothetical protein
MLETRLIDDQAPLQLEADAVEQVIAPAAIERALAVYQQLRERDPSVVLQAGKILTQHIYGMVDLGECDQQRLVVGGLAQLMAVERDHEIKSAQKCSI